jgi:predicted Zn-dependent protease
LIDLTVILLTLNLLPPEFQAYHLETLLKSIGNTPLITIPISVTPIVGFCTLAVVALIILSSHYTKVTTYVAQHIPRSWEESLGKQVLNIFTHDKKECKNKKGIEALNSITTWLSAAIPQHKNYTITVIDYEEINALALPADQILIFSGLIKASETPENLAGVIAHEMGHIVENHPMQAATNALGLSLLATLLVGDGSGATAVSVANTLISSKYSRDLEEVADQRAVEYLVGAKINPKGLSQFLEAVEKQNILRDFNNPILDYFSSHPATPKRIERLNELSRSAPIHQSLLTDDQWQSLKNICNE